MPAAECVCVCAHVQGASYHEQEAGAVARHGVAPRDIARECMDVRPGLEAAQVHIQALCKFGWGMCVGEGRKRILTVEIRGLSYSGRTWYSVDLLM